jgi:hypothetical protein
MSANLKQTDTPRTLLTPQMGVYDALGLDWQSFLMFFHTANVRTPTVNTDTYGFRLTHFNGREYSVGEDHCYPNEVSFIVGGSTAFGVGATSDKTTIASLLSEKSGHLFLNIGGRAFGANQEMILFNQIAHKYPRTNTVVILSGLNELYLSRFRNIDSHFGTFFFSEEFRKTMNQTSLSPNRKLLQLFLSPIFGESIDYQRIQRRDLLKFFRNRLKPPSDPQTSLQVFDAGYAVNQLRKNLYVWKKLSESVPFHLKFVLQPVPQWCSKPPSKEESILFDFLEKSHDHHRVMSHLNKALYLDYANKIGRVCEEFQIEFADMNIDFGGDSSTNRWLFVDRAHLTDMGNMEASEHLYNIVRSEF